MSIVFGPLYKVRRFWAEVKIRRSFNTTTVWEQRPRSHHKGATSMQTNPVVRVGFELATRPDDFWTNNGCRGVVGNITRYALAAVGRQFEPYNSMSNSPALWVAPRPRQPWGSSQLPAVTGGQARRRGAAIGHKEMLNRTRTGPGRGRGKPVSELLPVWLCFDINYIRVFK